MAPSKRWLPFLAMFLVAVLPLSAQFPVLQPDSAQRARAYALCGPLADDSVQLGLLSPGAGSLVSERFRGLRGPELVSSAVALEYPWSLRRQRIEGTVLVSVIIDTVGQVEPGTIKLVAAPHADFFPAVERFLRAARFRPGELHGQLLRVCMIWPLTFHVNG